MTTQRAWFPSATAHSRTHVSVSSGRGVRYAALVAAILLGLTVGWLFASLVQRSVENTPELALRDWTQIWRGAHAMTRGENPWGPSSVVGLPYPYRDRLGYPLPALWLGSLFMNISMGTFAFWWVLVSVVLATIALARRNLLFGVALVSWPAMGAAALLQWSPLLLAAARFDFLVPLAACKPNLGIAILAYRPTVRRLLIVGTVAIASVAFDRGWISNWLEAASSLHYVPPIFIWRAGGPLLLLAALRWKLPEGRLLLALSAVPQNLMSYDQFLLFLVCRKGRDAALLMALSWLAHLTVVRASLPGMSVPVLQHQFPIPTVLFLYLPALVMVLLRPAPKSFEIDPVGELHEPVSLRF